MKIYSDGFCIRGNPSKIGGGYSIVDENNNLLCCQEIFKEGFTNNEGELLGCIKAMELANVGDTISVDSRNTISWIMYSASIPRKDPEAEAKRARKDLDDFKKKGLELMKEKHLSLIFEGRENNLAGIYNEKILDVDRWINKFKHGKNL